VWLLIPEGFYSVVQKKPGEAELCVRARDRCDLDRLRERYMPELGPTTETPGGDYRYRAWIGREALAEGLGAIGRDLAYTNFKSEVGRRDPERARLYGRVWSTLGSIQPGGPYAGE
jgi:hypothetical protein